MKKKLSSDFARQIAITDDIFLTFQSSECSTTDKSSLFIGGRSIHSTKYYD